MKRQDCANGWWCSKRESNQQFSDYDSKALPIMRFELSNHSAKPPKVVEYLLIVNGEMLLYSEVTPASTKMALKSNIECLVK